MVLFGKTERQWKDENSIAKGNIKDAVTLNNIPELNARLKKNCNLPFREH